MPDKFTCFILLAAFLGHSSLVQATHETAFYIHYKCLGGTLYEVTLTSIYNCDATPAPMSQNIILHAGSPCTIADTPLSLTLRGARTVSHICPSFSSVSACRTGSVSDFQEYFYQTTVDLSAYVAGGCGWRFSYSTCCRTSIVNGFTGGSSSGINIETQFLDPSIGCNSSPRPNHSAIHLTCDSLLTHISHLMYDPDGDSLSYELAAPIRYFNNSTGLPVLATYAPGLSAERPFYTTNDTVFFDTKTGDYTFTPRLLNSLRTAGGIMELLVHEHRQGRRIGTSRRTAIILVNNCQANPSAGSQLVQSELWDGSNWVPQGQSTHYQAALGQNARFRLTFESNDPADSLYIERTFSTLFSTYNAASMQVTYPIPNRQMVVEVDVPVVGPHGFVLAVSDSKCGFMNLRSHGIIFEQSPVLSQSGPEVLPLRVFPNPVGSVMQFQLPAQAETTHLVLYHSTGTLALQKTIAAGQTQLALQRRDLPAGLYGYQWYRADGRPLGSGKLLLQ